MGGNNHQGDPAPEGLLFSPQEGHHGIEVRSVTSAVVIPQASRRKD